jgi:hypothetical protein
MGSMKQAWRLVAATVVALGAGQSGCASGVDAPNAQRAEPPAANRAREAGRTVSAAPTLQLPALRPRPAPTDGIEARVAPSQIASRGAAAEQPWLAFDSDPTTGFESSSGRVELELRHRAAGIDAVRLRGPLRATITLLDASSTEPSSIEGIDRVQVDIAEGAWKTLASTARSAASTMVLRVEGTAPIRLTEVELWGQVSAMEIRPAVRLADTITREDPGLLVATSTKTNARVSVVDQTASDTASSFPVTVPFAAACRRAFLRYSLEGAAHWTGVIRSVNGSEASGSSGPHRVEHGGLQVEELSPSLLRAGDNIVRFEPVSELGPSGYVVRDLSIVCAADARFDRADDPRTDDVLFDGRDDTGILSSNRSASAPTLWDFGRAMQAHVVAFKLAEGSRGSIELAVEGSDRRESIALRGRRPGWNVARLLDQWPSGAVRATVALARESAGGISELRVLGSPTDATEPSVIVTYPHHGECRDGAMNVRGYVRSHGGRSWRIRVLGHETTTNAHGEWSLRVPFEAGSNDGELAVTAEGGGARTTAYVRAGQCAPSTPSVSNASHDSDAPFAEWVQPDRAATVRAGDLQIDVPRGAVARATRITVRPLANEQVARLDPGMTNVTRGARAYRLGPHPMRFLSALKLTVPIDPSLVPRGKSRHDVTIYYYDEGARQWRALRGDEVRDGDFAAGRTDHFTDFIAATGSDAEGAQGGAGDRNSLGSLGAGAPFAGLDVIPAPTANAQGTATTGLTLRLPPGRQGMAPVVRVAYDSSGGNGLLGVGWSMPVPSISIDTRWGVPKYRGDEDRYLLDGQPIVHSATISDTVDEYQPRVLGAPLRIRRIRNGTSITWEVTDADGRTSTFGGLAATLCARTGTVAPTFPEPVATPLARCGLWAVKETIDRYGNFVEYHYSIDDGTLPASAGPSGAPWSQLYLSSITYTGHREAGSLPDVSPYYTVDFGWEPRVDVQLSARLGFLTRTAKRLTSAIVRTPSEEVRRYRFSYVYSAFEQSLLSKIQQFGSDGASLLYEYSFGYEAGQRGFTNSRQWNSGRPGFPMDAGHGNSYGGSFWGGVGDPAFVVSIGGSVGGSGTWSHTTSATVDVNGDGLPDFLHRDGRLRLNSFRRATPTSPRDPNRGVLRSDHVLADLENDLIDQHSDSLQFRVGISGVSALGLVGGTLSYSRTREDRVLEDVDGDGRVDQVFGPVVLGGVPVLTVRRNPFAGDRTHFGHFVAGSTQHDYTLGGLRPFAHEATLTGPQLDHLRALSHDTEPLVRWKARNRARVRIEGGITVPASVGDGVHASIIRATSSGETVLWEHDIEPGAGPCVPSVDGAASKCSGPWLEVPDVQNSDRLYFRVQARSSIDGDETLWSPIIRELDRMSCVPVQDPGQPPCSPTAPLEVFSRADDFRLADRDTVAFAATYAGRVRVSGSFTTAIPVRVRTYRKRLVPPPGTAWPVLIPGTTNPVDFVDAMVAAGAAPQVQVMRSPSESDDNGTLFMPGTHTLESREFDVEERDQVIVHALVDDGADPGAISNWNVAVSQIRVRPGSTGPAWDVATTCTSRGGTSPAPGAPPTTTTRQCDLVDAPAGTIAPAESQVRVAAAEVAAAFQLPSGLGLDLRRPDPLFGWYRGWSVGEWNGSAVFAEDGLTHPFGTETPSTLVRLAAAGSPIPAPASGPVIPRSAGELLTIGRDTVADKRGTPLLRGLGLDSFVTATSMKPSARSAWRRCS